MRVLTFMSLGETKSEVMFDDLCKELNFGLDEVEALVIEGTKNLTYGYLSWYLEKKYVCLLLWASYLTTIRKKGFCLVPENIHTFPSEGIFF